MSKQATTTVSAITREERIERFALTVGSYNLATASKAIATVLMLINARLAADAGVKQADIAAVIGVSRSHYSGYWAPTVRSLTADLTTEDMEAISAAGPDGADMVTPDMIDHLRLSTAEKSAAKEGQRVAAEQARAEIERKREIAERKAAKDAQDKTPGPDSGTTTDDTPSVETGNKSTGESTANLTNVTAETITWTQVAHMAHLLAAVASGKVAPSGKGRKDADHALQAIYGALQADHINK